MIKLINVSKTYKSDDIEVLAIDNLSLELPDKGLVSIYGASGCGKTTLLNLIGGLDKVDSGKIIVSNKDTSLFKEEDWDSYRNQEVGFIFQNYYLLPHLNIYDNIAITLQMANDTKDLKERVEDALDQVGLLSFKKRLPKTLSGGQQQRVAIARALITKPSLILADEPTGALDSKNSVSVMEQLKKISEKHLVVMVTHNEELARKYSDRMIQLLDGKVIKDEALNKLTYTNKETKDLKRTHLRFKQTGKWAYRNIWKKKSRSFPIMIASAVGFMAAGIVLSITNQVNEYTRLAQSNSLGKYPVYVNSYAKVSSASHEEELIEFPDTPELIIEKYDSVEQTAVVNIQKEFMTYMDNMPNEYYTGKYVYGTIAFKFLNKKYDNSYSLMDSSSYMNKLVSDFNFLRTQYDVIKGRLPEKPNEILLAVDTFNRLDINTVKALGFDTNPDTIDFDDIINKEYRYVSNDLYYTKVEGVAHPYYKTKSSSSYADIYSKSEQNSMQIVGILRPRNKDITIFNRPLLYTEDFGKFVIEDSNNSQILKDQIAYKNQAPSDEEIVDILSGNYFVKKVSSGYTLSEKYQYEARIYSLGEREVVTSIYYYTSSFDDRLKIVDYFNEFKPVTPLEVTLRTKDYLESVTTTFSGLVKTFSGVVLMFSFIAIAVSMILNAVLTYISVLERKREIGLLRSVGARKADIFNMFVVENGSMGLIAGIIASIGAVLIAPLLSNLVVGMIRMYQTDMLNSVEVDLTHFTPWVIPVMIVGSIIVSMFAANIPAALAVRKKPADIIKE